MRKALVIASLAESLLNFRKELLQKMMADGYAVHVAAPGIDAALFRQLQALGCVCHTIPLSRNGLNPVADLQTLLALHRLCRELSVELVLAYTIKPVIYGMLAAWLAGVPRRAAMITGLGFAFTAKASGLRALVAGVAQRLYRLALARAAVVFFQNPDDRALFERLGLVDAGKCVLVNGSGVNVAHYQPVPVPPLVQGMHFLLIARLLADKGVREYAAAARLVRAQYPDAVFHLVGWIDSNPTAISQSELDGWVADGTVQFHGRLSDVRPVINRCHVYVLPSYREGTPRTVLEAMSVGRAVITTDAPGCRETVVDGLNGWMVPVADSTVLADAMLRFIREPEQVVSMGEAARQYVVDKYDVHAVNAVITAALEKKC